MSEGGGKKKKKRRGRTEAADNESSSTRKEKSAKTTITPRQNEQLMLMALCADVDELLKLFNERQGTGFYEFAQIFIDREFPTIFLGRYSMADLVEVCSISFLKCFIECTNILV